MAAQVFTRRANTLAKLSILVGVPLVLIILGVVCFNHSIHVTKGVGCSTCHGNIRQMPVVYKTKPLFMSWCLDCHRNPAQYLRPRDQIYNTAWTPPADQLQQGAKLLDEYGIRLYEMETGSGQKINRLTNCAICHR
jgi:hypothetical protein